LSAEQPGGTTHRGAWLYRNGIEERGRFLYNSYCLQNITFKTGDVVIDCGANSGDLFLEMCDRVNGSDYIAFEPNPVDYVALKYNVKKGGARAYNLALGDISASMQFCVSTKEGDSSLVEPIMYEQVIQVNVIMLFDFIKSNCIETIKLLKLEAEGFEPEILYGLGDSLKCIEYIALDGGYERGVHKQQTLIHCTNYLIFNGFEWVDEYYPWSRFLFRNKVYGK